jgi:hypothetical protein
MVTIVLLKKWMWAMRHQPLSFDFLTVRAAGFAMTGIPVDARMRLPAGSAYAGPLRVERYLGTLTANR